MHNLKKVVEIVGNSTGPSYNSFSFCFGRANSRSTHAVHGFFFQPALQALNWLGNNRFGIFRSSDIGVFRANPTVKVPFNWRARGLPVKQGGPPKAAIGFPGCEIQFHSLRLSGSHRSQFFNCLAPDRQMDDTALQSGSIKLALCVAVNS